MELNSPSQGNNKTQDPEVQNLIKNLEERGIHVRTPEEMEKMIQRVTEGESSLQDELNISDEAVEALYFMGYTKYRNRRYKDAADIFAFVVAVSPFHYNALFGLASSKQMLKEHQSAIIFYYSAAPYAKGNPAPWFHIGECYMAMQEKDMAKEAFQTVLKSTSATGPYGAYVERTKTILSNLG